MDRDTAIVRRFNRSYTQRIGALEESFLGMGLPLGAARLLYEIGARPGTVGELRARLGLDSGYLSRLLRRLQDEALVTVVADPADRRRRQVRLTATGRRRWRKLEDRSQQQARILIDPLRPSQRERLVTALATADLLVRAATVVPEPVPAGGQLAQQAVGHYFAELQQRFSDGFEAAEQSAHDVEALSPPGVVFVVAVSDGEPVACGGVQTIGPGTAEIKRMWVHPEWRGAGLGSRLLSRLEDCAGELDRQRIRLDTNDTLTEAIAMYRRAGYREIERYNDNPYARLWFEKRLPRR